MGDVISLIGAAGEPGHGRGLARRRSRPVRGRRPSRARRRSSSTSSRRGRTSPPSAPSACFPACAGAPRRATSSSAAAPPADPRDLARRDAAERRADRAARCRSSGPRAWPSAGAGACASRRWRAERGRGGAVRPRRRAARVLRRLRPRRPRGLAEAAAAAASPLDDALDAATDETRDGAMERRRAAPPRRRRRRAARGRVGRLACSRGEDRLDEAAAAAQRPPAPVRRSRAGAG